MKNCGHQHYSNIKKFTYQKNQKNFINFKKIPSQSNDLNENTGGFQISLKYVIDKYPHLNDINQFSLGITELVKIQKSPRFFVIKSFTEEDIHKVILSFDFSQSSITAGLQPKKEIKNWIVYTKNAKRMSQMYFFSSA